MINKKRLIRLTQQLIRIRSENPPGNESAIAEFVKNYLESLGLRPRIYEFKKNRSNVVAVMEGKDKRRSLLITPHLDTVPAGKNWHHDPFAASIHQQRVYGLGATDCKGNLGCCLEVITSLIEDGITLGYVLVFAATADEECGSGLGLIPLLERGILKPDAAIVLDSDDFEIIITQKGLIHLKVSIQGKRAHGAYPWLGMNAIEAAVRIIKDLSASSKSARLPHVQNKYLRPSTINIGTIRGGDKVNVVADWCEFELDYRYLPGESPQAILKKIRRAVATHAKKFTLEIEGIQAPYRIDRNHRLVQYLLQAIRKTGLKGAVKGSEGATTITFFQDKRIPAVATGVGCSGCAHRADEYVTIYNLYKGAQALEEFLKRYTF